MTTCSVRYEPHLSDKARSSEASGFSITKIWYAYDWRYSVIYRNLYCVLWKRHNFRYCHLTFNQPWKHSTCWISRQKNHLAFWYRSMKP